LISTTRPCPEPAILFLIATAAALVGGAGLSRRFHRAQHALRRHVPDAVARHILSGDNPTGGKRDVSVLFVDLRDYTSRVENSTPEQIHALLSRYTLAVSAIIRQYGGTVVEFGGDGMMAVFGAPDPLADKERASVEAARAIVDTVGALVGTKGGGQAGRIEVGIGVASGPAFTGIIPAADRLVWSAVGNTTNLASRLQALTRELSVSIAIDETTWDKVERVDAEFEQHLGVAIRGRQQGETVYTLSAAACSPSSKAGLSRIRCHSGESAADGLFGGIGRLGPESFLARAALRSHPVADAQQPTASSERFAPGHADGLLTKTLSVVAERNLKLLRAFPRDTGDQFPQPNSVHSQSAGSSTPSHATATAMLDATTEPAFACADDGRLVAWNSGMEKLLGYAAAEVLGKRCWEVLCGRDAAGNIYCCKSCKMSPALTPGEREHSAELEIRTASGAMVRVLSSTLVLRGDEDSELISIHIWQPENSFKLADEDGELQWLSVAAPTQ